MVALSKALRYATREKISRAPRSQPSPAAKVQYLFAGLPAGLYRLSTVAGDAVKFSVNVKMRGEKARIDFDLSPLAGKKIRNYVWVAGRTGSNLPGRWIEVERRSTPTEGLQ